MTYRIYFDFTNEATADAFSDAVMEWLTETVRLPTSLATKRAREVAGSFYDRYFAPRHWLYEDVSPSGERMEEDK